MLYIFDYNTARIEEGMLSKRERNLMLLLVIPIFSLVPVESGFLHRDITLTHFCDM